MRSLTLLFLSATLFGQSAKDNCAPRSDTVRRIFDVHLHALSTDDLKGWANAPSPIAVRGTKTPDTEAAHLAATLCAMKRNNIVRGVVSNDGGDWAVVDRWRSAERARFVSGYNVEDPEKFNPKELRELVSAGKVEVFAEFDPQYHGYAPNDSRLEPIWALLEELQVPIGIHMHPGPKGAPYVGYPRMRAAQGRPLLLEDVLVKHPKLRLYVMHAGYPFADELIALMYEHPQVYVDISVINWTRPLADFHAFLKRIVDAGFADRVMFGSDQMAWPQAIDLAVKAVESAPFLTAQDRDDIFYNNAERFFQKTAPKK